MYMIVPIIWKLDATRAQKWRYHFPCTMALYLQYHEVHAHCTGDLYGYLIYFCHENILMEVYWGQSVTKYVLFKEATLMYQNCYPYGYKAAH